MVNTAYVKSLEDRKVLWFHGFMKATTSFSMIVLAAEQKTACVEHGITNTKLFTHYIFGLCDYKTFLPIKLTTYMVDAEQNYDNNCI